MSEPSTFACAISAWFIVGALLSLLMIGRHHRTDDKATMVMRCVVLVVEVLWAAWALTLWASLP
jgi:hypothetical protein